jgi:tetratricopeptide (TPR) repeat protein
LPVGLNLLQEMRRTGALNRGKVMGGLRKFLRAAPAALALCGAAGGLGAAPAAEPDPKTLQRNIERLEKSAAAYDQGDCKTALRFGLPLIAATGSTGLGDEAEAVAHEIVVRCETESGANEKAYAHALAGTRLENSSDYLWLVRLGVELDTKEFDAAVATVEAMSQGRGKALNAIPLQWMWSINRQLKDAGKDDLRGRFLKVLAGDAYAPIEAYGPIDGFRSGYAEMLLAAGDEAAAGPLIAGLADPTALVRASLDPRTRAFVPPSVDFRAAAERQLALHKQAAAIHDDRLAPLNYAADDLRLLGRPQEALELLQSASARVDDPATFSDRDEQLVWWWDGIGRSHAALGQYEESVAAFGKGAALNEGGSLNISQVINLASYQLRFGRAEEALKTMAAFDDPKRTGSPYGEMQVRIVRGCARALTGRNAEAAADLAYLTAHDKDDPGGRTELLLCMGDLDGAAAAVIERLQDPERSAGALLFLSDYDDPPVPFPNDRIRTHLKALKERPDVKAAIEKAGGTRRFPLQRIET